MKVWQRLLLLGLGVFLIADSVFTESEIEFLFVGCAFVVMSMDLQAVTARTVRAFEGKNGGKNGEN